MFLVMNPRIVRREEIAIYNSPISKGGPDTFTEEDNEAMFTDPKVDGYETHLELHLGSLAGYTLQGKPTSMEKFVAYLNRNFGNPELGNLILGKLRVLRNQLEEFFKENQNEENQNEEKQSIWWFSEVSFVPSKIQVKCISAFCCSQTFHQIAAENGYTNPIEFVRDLLFSPEKNKSTLFIDGQKLTLEELLYQTKSPKNFGQDLKELEEKVNHQEQNNKTTEKKKGVLGEFLRRIISYYYFDFTDLTKLEKLLLMEKIIASASARVDMLGFKVVNQDDQEAQELLNSIKEKGTLNHLLLNFNRLLQAEDKELIFEDKELIFKLLNLIIKDRIRVVFIEIKSYFRPEVISLASNPTSPTNLNSPQDGDLEKLRRQPSQRAKIPDLSSEESRDVSHSLLAMFQFFARLSSLFAETEIPKELRSLSKLMSSQYFKRVMAMRSVLHLLKYIEIYFVRVNWPIVDQDPNSDSKFYLNPTKVEHFEPKLEVIQVSNLKRSEVIRSVLARVRNMFTEIFT